MCASSCREKHRCASSCKIFVHVPWHYMAPRWCADGKFAAKHTAILGAPGLTSPVHCGLTKLFVCPMQLQVSRHVRHPLYVALCWCSTSLGRKMGGKSLFMTGGPVESSRVARLCSKAVASTMLLLQTSISGAPRRQSSGVGPAVCLCDAEHPSSRSLVPT